MPTIVCVSHVAPWPATCGNAIRLQKLLLWLRSQGWRTILVLTIPLEDQYQSNRVLSFVSQLEIANSSHPWLALHSRQRQIQYHLRHGWPWRRLRKGSKKCVGTMQHVADELCPPHVNRLVRIICRQQQVECFFAYYAFAIQAFSGLPRSTRLICDTVELFSMPRTNVEGQSIKPVLAFSRSQERAMLERCDVAIGIQPVESAYLQQLIPSRDVITVGLDCSPLSGATPPSQSRAVIGIVASTNQANREGLVDFLKRCWPRIRQGCPGTELWLAGNLSEALLQEWQGPMPEGLKTLGWLEDLEAFYRQLRLVVNPVLRGTGLKIKTVEALAHCRPVVAYGVGLEGLSATDSPGWLEVADAAAMADACLALLQHPARCDALAEAAQRYAMREMSSDTVYQPLLRILQSCI